MVLVSGAPHVTGHSVTKCNTQHGEESTMFFQKNDLWMRWLMCFC
jgi:hypothetical protein